MSAWARYWATVLVVVAAIAVAGCTQPVISALPLADEPKGGCRTALGAYYLPKAVVKFKLVSNATETGFEGPPTLTRIADRKAGYCLDHLTSSFANDKLQVIRTQATNTNGVLSGATGLLTQIKSEADDKSGEILRNLITAVFSGLAGGPFDRQLLDARNQPGETPTILFDGQYDPSNADDAADVNQAIKVAGFCLVLEGIVPWRDIDNYCDNPFDYRKKQRSRPLLAIGSKFASRAPEISPLESGRVLPIKTFSEGIYYRPRLPYNFYLFHKKNRLATGGWDLIMQDLIEVENLSPLIRIGVDRTFFVYHKVTLDFDAGTLTQAYVDKPSEVAAIVQLPLILMQSVAALPANIFQVRIDQTKNEKDIANAHTALLNQQKAYLDKLVELQKAKDTVSKN